MTERGSEAEAGELEQGPVEVPSSRTAWAILTILVLFVGVFVTSVFLCSEMLYEVSRDQAMAQTKHNLASAIASYKEDPSRPHAERLTQLFLAAAFGRLDSEPYFACRLWRSLRLAMILRLWVLVLSFVAVIMVLCKKLLARRILIFSLFSLVILGSFESLVLMRDLRFVKDEYARDMVAVFRRVAAEADLTEQFPPMMPGVDRLSLRRIRQISVIYFVLSTAIWQVLLIILVAGRPTQRSKAMEPT